MANTVSPDMSENSSIQVTPTDNLPVITCTICNCKSNLPELFTDRNQHPRCPRCALKLRQQKNRGLYIFSGICCSVVLFVAIGMAFWGVTPLDRKIGYLNLNIVLAVLAAYPLIIPHEFAHVVMVWLLRGRIFAVHLGTGALAFRRKIGGVSFSVSRYPILGLCIFAFPTIKFIRMRSLLAGVAGLMMHLLLIVGLWPYIQMANFQAKIAWFEILFVTNIWLLVTNLLPHQIAATGNALGTDGVLLLKLLFNKLKKQDLHAGYYLVSATVAWHEEKYAEGLDICQIGLQSYPNNLYLQSTRALCLIGLEKFSEAYDAYSAIIHSPAFPKLAKVLQALNFNNVAWASLFNVQNPEHLTIAYTYALMSFQMIPWIPNVVGTLGALLIEKGELDDGIDYTLEAAEEFQKAKEPGLNKSIAINLAYAAIGYFRLGEPSEAIALLKDARQLCPNDLVVLKAQKEISAVSLTGKV